ncbi:MAG TPA: copper-binding protein [Methylomirabilota bacterium]|nr:copper-binding protein [Methylomirabilota bacterium]
MIPVWQVILCVNLTLAVGLGLGYAGWGRRAEGLGRDLEAVRVRVERLERERAACVAGARAGEQQWEARGVVRGIFPDTDLLVVTHEEIAGLLPARTTSFRAVSLKTHDALQVGDAIRFSLRGSTLEEAAIVAITGW